MHWNTDLLEEIYDRIQDGLANDDAQVLSNVTQLALDAISDLRGLLTAPTKSDASLKKLKEGTITVDDTEYQVNQQFMEVSILLSQELGLDELVSAELIQRSSADTTRLGMSPMLAALALFYVRRQYILDLVRFFLDNAAQTGTASSAGIAAHHVSAKVVGLLTKDGPLLPHVLQALKSVESSLQEVVEKEKRAQFMGESADSDFFRSIQLRRDFLYREHDTLGQILVGLVQNKHIDASGFTDIINVVKDFGSIDECFIHYVPAILEFLSSMDPVVTASDNLMNASEAHKVFQGLAGKKQNASYWSSWKLPYWRGAIVLAQETAVSGLCRVDAGFKDKFDYERDILAPSRDAIDDGAIEFLLALSSAISEAPDYQQYYDYRPSVQQRVPAISISIPLSDGFKTLLFSSLERFVESFVSNFADILKEMRLAEEDNHFARRNAHFDDEEYFEDDDTAPGVDLERFFMFISYLYSGRPEASERFVTDTESNLYGFLVWASHCEIEFMQATFCDMLASLASGRLAANAVFQFLVDDEELSASGNDTAMALARAAHDRKRTKFRISWFQIFKALAYYVEELSPKAVRAQQGRGSTQPATKPLVAPELPDDVLLMLHAYFRLISQVVKSDPAARDRLTTGSIVVDRMFAFLECQTPLYGPIFDTLAGFAQSSNETFRYRLWNSLNNWSFFAKVLTADGEVDDNVPIAQRLYLLLKSSSDVIGFVTLLDALLRPIESHGKRPYADQTLPYPPQWPPGMLWIYSEFVLNEVLYSSTAEHFSSEDKFALQLPCLRYVQNCLDLLDASAIRLTAMSGINTNVLVPGNSVLEYLRSHPFGNVMTCLFDDRTYTALVGIASAGIDEIAEKPPSHPLVTSVLASVKIMNTVLDLQDIFIDIMVREFRSGIPPSVTVDKTNDSSDAPKSSSKALVPSSPRPRKITRNLDTQVIYFSSQNLKSFEDALLFKLPIVAHLALYSGVANTSLAYESLSLLHRLSQTPQFNAKVSTSGDGRVRKNRLLSAFETVDESARIKDAFLEQLDRSQDAYQQVGKHTPIEIKIELLKFIISNLSPTTHGPKEPTVAHFLLGFAINGDGSLDLDTERGGILSDVSLLRSTISLLGDGLQDITSKEVPAKSSTIAQLCSSVVLTLCKSPLSSELVIQFLRDNSFLLTTLEVESTLSSAAHWDGRLFKQSSEFLTSDGAEAMISYFQVRAALLDYYSMEIHTSAEGGSLSLVEKYQRALVSLEQRREYSGLVSRSGKILTYLDILEFSTASPNDEPPQESIDIFGADFINYVFARIEGEDEENRLTSSFIKELDYVLAAKAREIQVTGDKELSVEQAKKAQSEVSNFIYKRLVLQKIRNSQLRCLHSWTKVVTVLVNDAHLRPVDRITFVMETFQCVIPKLIDYSSSDVAFSEVLASLSVSLLQLYQEDIKDTKGMVSSIGHDRTHALYRTALEAILTPHSTPELRSDLYIICYEYLSQYLRIGSRDILVQNLQCVRAAGDRLIETITSDALSMDGVPRLGAAILLRVLCELSVFLDSSFLLDALVRYNLLYMVVSSIKRTDLAISDRESHSAAQLFFEISAFKGLVCALLELARTKSGAQKIIQCGLFEVLQQCQFLHTDPDVGIEFDFDLHYAPGQNKYAADARVSFYEILVPVFQLVAAVLLSMGSENQAVIDATRQFLSDHHQLIVAVLKKDLVLSSAGQRDDHRLDELVKLVVLLVTLSGYSPKKF